jgi:ABC-type multidrug transport system fused ATPase/permease subunit
MSRLIERQEEEYTPSTLSLLRRAARYIVPFRVRFAGKFGLMLLGILPSFFLPWPVKLIIDHVVLEIPVGSQPNPYPFFIEPLLRSLAGATGWDVLAPMLVVQGVLIFLVGGFGSTSPERDQTGGNLSSGRDTATRSENQANEAGSSMGGILGILEYRFTLALTHRFNHFYRSALFRRIQSLPMSAFDDERIGDSVYRVMVDTPTLTRVCYRLLLEPAFHSIRLAVTAAGIYFTYPGSPDLALGAAAVLPIAFVATLPWARRVRARSDESRAAGATTTSTIEEGMANILAVQSLGGEAHQQEQFERDSWTSFGRYRDLILAYIFAGFSAGVPILFMIVLGFIYVTDEIIHGRLTPGDFALLFTYVLQIGRSAVTVGITWLSVQDAAAGLGRVFFLMDLPGDEDGGGTTIASRPRDRLVFDNVSLTHADGTQALRNIDFEAKIGEMVALAGPAGAGKTTLAYLIPRFLSPDPGGRVSLDGVDVSDLSLASLRDQVAFVFQEPALFADTVAENIRFGRPEATDVDVRRAAQLAGADEFIRALPQGYDTPLGRGGGKLSVGQKQRLTIARALVRDAPILILDEPTSALDPESERRLMEALRTLRRDRLVVVIAHRLSTIRQADQILFLDSGRIVERGSHDELMQHTNGAYRRFVELQGRGAA